MLTGLTEKWTKLRQRKGAGRDFSVALGTNLSAMGLGLFTGALTARLLGPTGRGQLTAIQLWGLLLMNLGSLGIPNALVYFTGRKREEVGQLITSAWAVMVPLSVIWIASGYFLLPLLLRNQTPEVVIYARLFLFILPLAYISRASMALQGLKNFTAWGLFRLHKPFLYAVALLLLGILGMATPYSAAMVIILSSTVGPILILRMIRASDIELSLPSAGKMRRMLHYGVRSVLGSLPEELNTRLDQLIIAIWLTDTELGFYAVAVSWSLILGPVVRAIDNVAFPYVAGNLNETSQLSLFTRSVRLSAFVIIIVNLGLLFITPLVIPLIFGQAFQPSVPVAMVLLVASSFYSLKLVVSSGLRGLGYPESTAYAEIISLLCTLLLLALLLPMIGIMGAAIASLFAYVLSVMILLYFTISKTPVTVGDLLFVTRGDIKKLKQTLIS